MQVSEGDIGFAFQILTGLGIYSLTVIVGLSIMIFIVYPFLIRRFAEVKFKTFFKAISPAQLLAFSTSSSAATLPLTMERVEEELGVSKRVSSFVLPLGATINMDGTALYQGVAAVFIAQAVGMDLTLANQFTIVATAVLASIGTAGVPGVGLIMLGMVLNQVGLPLEGIAIVMGVDRFLDMLRTATNVSGDAMISFIIDKSEK